MPAPHCDDAFSYELHGFNLRPWQPGLVPLPLSHQPADMQQKRATCCKGNRRTSAPFSGDSCTPAAAACSIAMPCPKKASQAYTFLHPNDQRYTQNHTFMASLAIRLCRLQRNK